jgi:predicted esterase
MGGMDAFYLMAVEPRIKVFAACVPPMKSDGYDPASPVDYTYGAEGKQVFMLMGSKDEMYDKGTMQAAYEAYVEGPETAIKWYDRGHKLTPEYVPDALAWIEGRL